MYTNNIHIVKHSETPFLRAFYLSSMFILFYYKSSQKHYKTRQKIGILYTLPIKTRQKSTFKTCRVGCFVVVNGIISTVIKYACKWLKNSILKHKKRTF
jgi:hypothetical protein